VLTSAELVDADGAVADLVGAGADVQAGFVADAHRGHFGHSDGCKSTGLKRADEGTGYTSVFDGLLPQQLGQLLGPGLLHVLGHRLQRERVVRFSLPEPDLEFGGAISDFRRQSDVGHLNTVLVDVQV
jgi:hypothetical protein